MLTNPYLSRFLDPLTTGAAAAPSSGNWSLDYRPASDMLNQLVRETDRRCLYLHGTFFTDTPTVSNALNVLERTCEP